MKHYLCKAKIIIGDGSFGTGNITSLYQLHNAVYGKFQLEINV